MNGQACVADPLLGTATIVRRYIDAYSRKDFATLRALLAGDDFRFSHLSQGASADSADEWIGILEKMAKDIFPDRRFVAVHGLHVIDDVALLDSTWKATPIITIPGRFEAGRQIVLRLKTFLVVRNGLIVEIRDTIADVTDA